MSSSHVNFSAVSGFFRLSFPCGLTFSVNSVCRGFCAVRVLFTTMIHPFTVFVYVVYVSCRGKGVFYWLTLLLLLLVFFICRCAFSLAGKLKCLYLSWKLKVWEIIILDKDKPMLCLGWRTLFMIIIIIIKLKWVINIFN